MKTRKYIHSALSIVSVVCLSEASFAEPPKLNCAKKLTKTTQAQKTQKSIKATNPFDLARVAGLNGDNRLVKKILDSAEKALLTDPLVAIENLGGGTTSSYLVTLKNGLRGVFKPVNPDRPNQPFRERAQYRLSKLWKVHMVPPTVIRKVSTEESQGFFETTTGSFQLFTETAKSLKKGFDSKGDKILLKRNKPFDPDQYRSGRRLRLFDWVTNNHDRGSNAGNYMVSKLADITNTTEPYAEIKNDLILFKATEPYIFGIDHSVSFVGLDKTARSDKVPYYKDEFLDDLEFYEAMASASEQQIRTALSGLRAIRITEFLTRLDFLLREMERKMEMD